MTELEEIIFIDDEDKGTVFCGKTQSHINALAVRFNTDQEIPIASITIDKMQLKPAPNMRKLILALWQETLGSHILITDEEYIYTSCVLASNDVAVQSRRGAANVMIMSENTLRYVQDYHLPVDWEFRHDSRLEITNYMPDGYIMLTYVPIMLGSTFVKACDRAIQCWDNNGKMNYAYVQDKVKSHIRLLELPEGSISQ